MRTTGLGQSYVWGIRHPTTAPRFWPGKAEEGFAAAVPTAPLSLLGSSHPSPAPGWHSVKEKGQNLVLLCVSPTHEPTPQQTPWCSLGSMQDLAELRNRPPWWLTLSV